MARKQTARKVFTFAGKPEPRRGVEVHPETGQQAPAGMSWVRNARFGGYNLEHDGTPFHCSVSSEHYWQS